MLDRVMEIRKLKLHPTQGMILENIDNERHFTIREWQEILDASSTSLIQHHLRRLVKKGFLRKIGKRYYRN